jgi:hypothetical protein
MNRKFVLESFQAYLDLELNPINEDKGTSEITPQSIVGLVQKLLDKQEELSAKNIRFKKYTSQADPYAAWKADQGETPAQTGEGELKFTSAFSAPYLFNKLTPEQKEDFYEEFSKTLNDYGYKKLKEVEKLISEKTTLITPPVVYVVTSKTKVPGPLVPVEGKPEEYDLVKEEDEHGIFKDNEWELKDTSFNSPETKAKLVDPIKEFVSGFASGNIDNIEYIVIQASANRYRNTGIAENVSWGELSFNRAKTIAAIFKSAADEFNLTEEQRTLLQSKISIDYGGSNGDGTSGPNPMDPIAFGYYNEAGKFIQNNGSFDKKRSTVVIDKLDGEGNPTGEATTKTIEPDADKAAYEKYKYVNVTIKATIKDIIPTEEWIPTEIENVEYKPGFKIPRKGVPSKGSGTGGNSPRRKIIGKPGKGPSRRGCPLDLSN